MPEAQIDSATHDGLMRVAAQTGEPATELAAKWLKFGPEIAEMRHRIENFHGLADARRREFADRAGDFASGAQLMALDAEGGGYDWGPNGPPGDDR